MRAPIGVRFSKLFSASQIVNTSRKNGFYRVDPGDKKLLFICERTENGHNGANSMRTDIKCLPTRFWWKQGDLLFPRGYKEKLQIHRRYKGKDPSKFLRYGFQRKTWWSFLFTVSENENENGCLSD